MKVIEKLIPKMKIIADVKKKLFIMYRTPVKTVSTLSVAFLICMFSIQNSSSLIWSTEN